MDEETSMTLWLCLWLLISPLVLGIVSLAGARGGTTASYGRH
jgi:hypothetical protein